MWLRKVLQVTEDTESPSVLSEIVRPTMDVFGWDRLGGVREFDNTGAAAPALIVNGPVTPIDVVRLVTHASVVHTDVGLDHLLWITKVLPAGAGTVGVHSPALAVPINVDEACRHWIYLQPGTLLRGHADVALIAGALVLDLEFIDLPIGEYIPT